MSTAAKDRPSANGLATDRPLSSADNERAVVGAIIAAVDSAAAFAEASTYVSSSDFVDPMAAAAFEAMAEIVADRGDPGDVMELARRLKASGDLDNTLSISGIAEQLQTAPSSVNLHFAAADVKRAAERLNLQYTLDAAQASIRDRGDPIAVASRLREDVDDFCRRAMPMEDRLPVLDATAFSQAIYQTVYVVAGVMAALQPMILAGPQKTLKTTLALAMAVAIAAGRRFLGAFEVLQPGRVLYLSGECGLGTVQEILFRICDWYEISLADLGDNLLICDRLPAFNDAQDMAAFTRLHDEYEPAVTFMDTAYLSFPSDGVENMFVNGPRLRKLSSLCIERGSTPVLLHHANRRIQTGDPMELSDIAYAGFGEFARQWLLLNRRSSYGGERRHDLWLTVGGSAGHGGIWGVDVDENGEGDRRGWSTKLRTIDEIRSGKDDQKQAALDAVKEAQSEADRRVVVEYLAKRPDGETKSEIRDATGLGRRTGPVLASLEDDKMVVPCSVERANGQGYAGFKLSESE